MGRRLPLRPGRSAAAETGPIVTNRVLIVPYAGQAPQVPPGFTATPFATGLVNPRRLLVLPNGDVLVAEQSAGYLTLLRDDGSGHAVWIDRHVEDLNRPYGLAWQGDHVLVADQDGIWSVPHSLGALARGPQRVSTRRSSAAGGTQTGCRGVRGRNGHPEGRIRHRARPSESSARRRSQIRRALCRCRLLGQCRRRARTEGDDPAFRCGRLASNDLRVRHAQPDRARIPAADRRPLRGSCRSATASATSALRLSDPRAAGRLLRLALRLYRQASAGGLRQPRAGQGAGDASCPTCCSRRTRRCSTSCFMTASNFRPNTKAALSSRSRARGIARSRPATRSCACRSRTTSRKAITRISPPASGSSGERRAEVWGRPAALAVTRDGALLVADDTGGTIWRIAYTGAARRRAERRAQERRPQVTLVARDCLLRDCSLRVCTTGLDRTRKTTMRTNVRLLTPAFAALSLAFAATGPTRPMSSA